MFPSASHSAKYTMLMVFLGGLGTLFLCIGASSVVIIAPLAAFAGGTSNAGTGSGGGSSICIAPPPTMGSTPSACSVVTWAQTIATHLTMCGGDPIQDTPAFDKCYAVSPDPDAMPPAVLTYLATHYPQNEANWISGNFQCVSLVIAAYGLAGLPLPKTSDAVVFWANYRTLPGWQAIPTANGPLPGTPGVAPGPPEPGDLIVWQHIIDAQGDQDAGHIAIITAVNLPEAGQNGSITFAQANSFAPFATVPLTPALLVLPWPGGTAYTPLGYLRSTRLPPAPVATPAPGTPATRGPRTISLIPPVNGPKEWRTPG